MNNQSDLQRQYPLSPKKFWKKIIEYVIPMVFVDLIVGLFIGFVAMFFYGIATGNFVVEFFTIIKFTVPAFFALFIVHASLYSWYISAYIRRYYYDAGENFVTIKKGVFAPAEIHVQYLKIQDVYVDQDILDRIMGLYDVHIASATVTSGMEAHIDGVEAASAEALKNLLLSKIQSRSVGGSPGGGVGNVAAGISPNDTPIKASFNEEISSSTFPISGRWMITKIASSFIGSIFYAAFIAFYISLPHKNSTTSLVDAIGLGSYSVAIIVAIFAFLFCVQIAYFILWKNNFIFSFTPDFIYIKTGIIAKREQHVPYNTLQDVSVVQGVIDRFFGLATVQIENATMSQLTVGRNGGTIFSGISLPGQNPESAKRITEALKTVILSKSNTAYQTGL